MSVFVFGSFVVDLMCRTPHLPRPGETVFGGPFKMGPGGKGSNQAVAARRAGAEVALLTKLGDDLFGRMARDTFAAEGIDTQYVYPSNQHETGAALIMVEDGTAQNAITVSVGACNHITEAEVDGASAHIAAAKVFLTQFETNMDAMFRALGHARKAGVTTIVNPAPVQPVNPADLTGVDYFTPNETEAEALTGLPVRNPAEAEKAAAKMLGWGVKHVLVTLGRQGVLVKTADESYHVPAFDIGQAVDTTGAGDAFNGGFASAIAEGMPLKQAVRFGCAVAGLSVTKVGTAPAMPLRHEVDALMQHA